MIGKNNKILPILHWALNMIVVPYIIYVNYKSFFIANPGTGLPFSYVFEGGTMTNLLVGVLVVIEFSSAFLIGLMYELKTAIITYITILFSFICKFLFILTIALLSYVFAVSFSFVFSNSFIPFLIGLFNISFSFLNNINTEILFFGRYYMITDLKQIPLLAGLIFLCVPTLLGIALAKLTLHKLKKHKEISEVIL